MADSDEGLEEALKGGFLKCLLQYVDSDGDVAGRLRLEPAQYVKRRDQALTLLRSLLHRTPAAFVEHRGVVILLRFLQQCDDAVGTTRGLSLLLEACSHAECLSDLQEEAAVDLLLLLAQDPALAEEARGTCYLAMATLGRSGPAFVAQFRERGGVPLMHRELQRACARDPTMPSSFVATAVGAAWACICPSKRSLATFLVADGMDVVLDLLDSGGQHLRGLLLGFLADMLHNPKSHAFFHEWRSSQSGEGAAHVLLEMWREEESARGVGAGATLRSMTRPLEGMGERTNWVPSMRLTYSLRDPKKLELVEAFDKGCNGNSLLTKIFCCLHLLGWEGLEYISAADKVTLTMVKGYVRLRQGEIWADIQVRR